MPVCVLQRNRQNYGLGERMTVLGIAEMDITAEMAALGLPSSFVARVDVVSKKKSKRKSDPSSATAENWSSKATDLIDVEAFQSAEPGENGSIQAGKLHIRSVRLFTAADCRPEVVQERVDYTTGIGVEVSPADGNFESRLNLSPEQYDFTMVATGETEVVATSDPARYVDSDAQLVVDDDIPVNSEVGSESMWEPVWDDEYQRYYYFNKQTRNSTWVPPPEFEYFGMTSSVGWQNEVLDPVDYPQAIGENSMAIEKNAIAMEDKCMVSGECNIGETSRASGVGMPSTLVISEHVDCEEGIVSTCQHAAGSESLTTVIRRGEGAEEQTLMEQELDSNFEESKVTQDCDDVPLPGPFNSHIRFGDNSSSNSSDADEDEAINWEEMREESFATLIARNLKDEVRGHSLDSRHGLSTIQHEIALHANGLKLVKTRRFRARSGLNGDVSKRVVKYWLQRYSLFGRYDEGVKLDEEGWYSVTPEVIAKHQASRCAAGLVVDAFTGVGGNAIQLALTCNLVVAIDIDPVRVEYARHNAEIYGVAHKIEFIVGDFFKLAPFLKADVVFLSPPWGGPEYLQQEVYDLHTMLQPKAGITLFKAAHSIAPSIALFVPRNVDLNQLLELSWLSSPPLPCEAEKNFVNGKLKAVTAYYGDIAR